MLRQKGSYRNGIETRKKPKSKKKVELMFAIQPKHVKANLSTENADI